MDWIKRIQVICQIIIIFFVQMKFVSIRSVYSLVLMINRFSMFLFLVSMKWGKNNDRTFRFDSICLSLMIGWKQIFRQEQQKLKANDHSVLKCLVLDRWLYECTKVKDEYFVRSNKINSWRNFCFFQNSDEFSQRTKEFYDDIRHRMRCEFPQDWVRRFD